MKVLRLKSKGASFLLKCILFRTLSMSGSCLFNNDKFYEVVSLLRERSACRWIFYRDR